MAIHSNILAGKPQRQRSLAVLRDRAHTHAVHNAPLSTLQRKDVHDHYVPQYIYGFLKSHCMHAKLLQSCPTLYDLMDCNSPGSSVHGIL